MYETDLDSQYKSKKYKLKNVWIGVFQCNLIFVSRNLIPYLGV